jgi:protein-S-isoprenylcysteine O-methyltransferase Ste14
MVEERSRANPPGNRGILITGIVTMFVTAGVFLAIGFSRSLTVSIVVGFAAIIAGIMGLLLLSVTSR